MQKLNNFISDLLKLVIAFNKKCKNEKEMIGFRYNDKSARFVLYLGNKILLPNASPLEAKGALEAFTALKLKGGL